MNSKISAQILYSSFVLLLIIVDSLQSPISEDKRVNHELLRFSRNPGHQLMHFGKRNPGKLGIDFNEDEIATDMPKEISNDIVDQDNQNKLLRMIFEKMSGSAKYPDSPQYMSIVERRSENRPLVSYAVPREYYLKKADRGNVFMHFG